MLITDMSRAKQKPLMAELIFGTDPNRVKLQTTVHLQCCEIAISKLKKQLPSAWNLN